MSDWLATTTIAFLDTWNNLVAGDEPGRRHLRRLAEQLSVQRNNVGIGHDFIDICLWDLADNTIAWIEDPDDEQRQLDMVQSRSDFRAACFFQTMNGG